MCSARNLSSCFRGAIWAVGVGARRGQSSERRGHRSGARGSWRTVGKSGGTGVVISCASREWGSPEPRRSTRRARPRPRSQSHGVRAAWRTADSDPRNPNPADEAKRSRVCPVKRTSASSPPPARDRQSLTTFDQAQVGFLTGRCATQTRSPCDAQSAVSLTRHNDDAGVLRRGRARGALGARGEQPRGARRRARGSGRAHAGG